MDSQVAAQASRIIEGDDGFMVVDATDGLLVESGTVVANMTGNPDVVAMELFGRVNHREEVAYVLTLFEKSEVDKIIGLMVEAMLQIDPNFGPEIVTKIVRLVGERNAG